MHVDFTRPVFVVNFKAYCFGKNAVALAEVIEREAINFGVQAVVCVQASDIHAIQMPVFAQHVDVGDGAFTGSINASAVKQAGASGTLLNHAEKRVIGGIKEHIECAEKSALSTLVCVQSLAEIRKVAKYSPDAIAIEIPSLIGTKNSISSKMPKLVSDAAVLGDKLHIPVLCGSGINTAEDVRSSFELGAKGILVSSAIVKAEHPGKIIKEMLGAVK